MATTPAATFLPRTSVEEEQNVKRRRLIKNDSKLPYFTSLVIDQLLSSCIGMESQLLQLQRMLEPTLVNGQNTSIIINGPPGSGKSVVLRKVLHELKAKHVPHGRSFVEVYLNGRIHTDDIMAIRDTTRQLAIENETDERTIASTSDEFGRSTGDDFYAHLTFMYDVLDRAAATQTSVFFIIDHIEHMAQHSKQTLLYNLCDLLQSSRARIAIIGLTSRLDFQESLEKRVRSRFVYQQILCGRPTFQLLLHMLVDMLTVSEKDVSTLCCSSDKHKHLSDSIVCNNSDECQDELCSRLIIEHNISIQSALKNCHASLRLQHALGRSVQWFCTVFVRALCLFATNEAQSFSSVLELTLNEFTQNWSLVNVPDCTTIQLAMLVAVCQLVRKEVNLINFSLIYHEYLRYCNTSTNDMLYTYPKYLCLRAFEDLIGLDLLRYVDTFNQQLLIDCRFRPVLPAFTERSLLNALNEMAKRESNTEGGLLVVPTWLAKWADHFS